MPGSQTARRRVAYLLPASFADSQLVDPEVIDPRFSCEVFPLAGELRFLNDLDRTIAGLHMVEAGIRAEAEGFDAVIIGSSGDYGLRELRAAVRIPVIGVGQATLQLTSALSDRFGLLTVWPRTTHEMYRHLLRDYGLENRCVGIRHVLAHDEFPSAFGDGGMLDAMHERRPDVVTTLVEAARDLVVAGAGAIAVGCTCMAPVCAQLQDALGCPVVQPLNVAEKMAESMVILGVSHAAAPVRAHFAASMGDLIAAVAEPWAGPDACGDTCSVLAATAGTLAEGATPS